MRRVTLLRHGATQANELWLYCGATDVPLSEAGEEKLRELRRTRTYPDLVGARIYTSGLARTEQTLRLLYGDVPHAAVPALREMNFGAFEMRSYEELQGEPAFQAWLAGDHERNRCPGGESGTDMTRRALEAFSKLLETEGDILIVAHGGPVAAIMGHLFPDEKKGRCDWQPNGGEGYTVAFDGGRPAAYTAVPAP